MFSRKLRIPKLLALPVILLAVLLIVGCKKKAEERTVEHPAAPSVQAETSEQTTCPVMAGNPIDKNIFVEYQGKKVYFCCPACISAFEKEPEKYLDKLPQFQTEAEALTKEAQQKLEEELDQLEKQTKEAEEKAVGEMEKAAEKMPEIK